MKCPNCGCANFYESTLRTGCGCTEGGAWEPIELNGRPVVAYLCKKCGRVELYAPDALADILKKEEETKRKQEEEILKEKAIKELRARREELLLIVRDENRTVKEVNAARNEIASIENKLKQLGVTLNTEVRPVGN